MSPVTIGIDLGSEGSPKTNLVTVKIIVVHKNEVVEAKAS
jgi:hypothetical protein